jgi:hypothetical protein
VDQALGEARGYMAYGSTEVLMYERGRVELKDGVVSSVRLISEEELARRKEEQERQRLAEEERRALLYVEGTALRDKKLEDVLFTSAPAAERMAYWRTFRSRYPMVDITEPYALALRELEIDLASKAQEADTQRQIAELERRVSEAERRARTAEDEARRSRSTTHFVSYAGYPVGRSYYYGRPWKYPRSYYSKYPASYYGTSHGRTTVCTTYPSTPSWQRHTPGVVYTSSSGYTRCATPSYRSSHITARISF